MAERTCADCGADISGRHWRSQRCVDCQRERERQALIGKKPTLYERNCGYCGRTFKARSQRQRACSLRCGGRLGHPGNVDRICVVCDKLYTTSRQYNRPTCEDTACYRWRRLYPGRKPIRECRWCGGCLIGKALSAEWCNARCWHAAQEGVSWKWIQTRRCVVCDVPIPRSVHYHRTTCSQACHRRNRSPEVIFRQTHARRRHMEAAKVYRVPKAYIRKLRTLPCFWCGGPGGTADHVVPISRGGKHSEGNLVPACRRCNSSKGDRLVMEWRRRQETKGLPWLLAAKSRPAMPLQLSA